MTEQDKNRNIGTTGISGTTGSTSDIGTTGAGGMTGGSVGGGDMTSGVRRAWRTGSPDEVKEEVKRMVEKGVAAVAGALKGFTETAQREDMPGQAKEAVHQVGETAKSVAGEAQTQVSSVGESAKGLTKEVKSQVDTMRNEMGGSKSRGGSTMTGTSGAGITSGTSGTLDTLGPSDLGAADYRTPTGGAAGVAPGAPSTAERDLSAMTEEERARGRERTRERDRI